MFRFEDPPGLSPFMSMGAEPSSPLVQGLTPTPARAVTAQDVSDEVLSGAWVVDLRETRDRRSTSDPATPVGWLRPADDGFVLLGDSPEALAEWLDLTA